MLWTVCTQVKAGRRSEGSREYGLRPKNGETKPLPELPSLKMSQVSLRHTHISAASLQQARDRSRALTLFTQVSLGPSVITDWGEAFARHTCEQTMLLGEGCQSHKRYRGENQEHL